MNAPLQAAYYADRLRQVECAIVDGECLARDTYRVRIEAPQIAAAVVPGQFVMLRIARLDDPLIGRALAIYDVVDDASGRPWGLDLVYIRKGKLTRRLADSPVGTRLSVWGPLGNGFATTPCETLVMAAGGIGQTPFLALAKEALGQRTFGDHDRPGGWAARVRMVYGARSADLLAGLDDFRATGIDLRVCTDDGSAGDHGRVPEVVARLLAEEAPDHRVRVVCCGPEIMMEKVADVARERNVPCEVSMETPMACGIGICFSCVARVRQSDGGWDYKRTCVEGPVFDASRICW